MLEKKFMNTILCDSPVAKGAPRVAGPEWEDSGVGDRDRDRDMVLPRRTGLLPRSRGASRLSRLNRRTPRAGAFPLSRLRIASSAEARAESSEESGSISDWSSNRSLMSCPLSPEASSALLSVSETSAASSMNKLALRGILSQVWK